MPIHTATLKYCLAQMCHNRSLETKLQAGVKSRVKEMKLITDQKTFLKMIKDLLQFIMEQ